MATAHLVIVKCFTSEKLVSLYLNMWIKLLQRESIKDLIKPTFIGGVWRKPAIQGRQVHELKKYFDLAGVPWIYSKERPEIHSESAYNRKPKGTHFSNNYETRLAMIRKNLATQPDKLMKLRLDRLADRKMTKDEQIWTVVLKTIN